MEDLKNKLSQIRCCRVSHLIEEQIKQLIFDNHCRVNDKLPAERELAEIFQASRTSVREALRSLEKSGFLTIKKGNKGGAFISKIDPRLVVDSFNNMIRVGQVSHEEILQARLIFEPPIAAEAAKKANKKDVARLEKANQELAEGYYSSKPGGENNPTIHKIIAEVSGNRVLSIIMDVLMDIHALRMKSIQLDEKGKKGILHQHGQIIDAIRSKDERLAFEAVRKHILHTYKLHTKLEKEG
jgi:GntR family transcriptional repressor for pyruvate dehydrogenase complex